MSRSSAVVVHVLSLDAVDDARLALYRSWLPDEEQSGRRDRICARALARWCLSLHAPVPPRAWSISHTDAGKPFVAGGPQFNLSHADGLVACAIAARPVGVDVMALRRADDVLATVFRAFAPSEIDEVRALPAGAQARRALELWTAKEAYLKGLGTGIARHLDRFTLAEASSAGFLVCVREYAGRWLIATATTAGAGADDTTIEPVLPT